MKFKILPLMLACLASLIILSMQSSADFIDEFNSPNLDKKIWDIKTVGNGS